MLQRWVLVWALPSLGFGLPGDQRPPRAPLAAGDAVALVQGKLALRKTSQASSSERLTARSQRRQPWGESSTIGDIAPRILTEDAIEALRRSSSERFEEETVEETGVSEATAETLAASLGVGLNRITARLDIHLQRVMRAKEKLVQTVASAAEGPERLQAFETAMDETLNIAQQGGTTVSVVLRSTVSSTEANLETAGQRDLAGVLEDSLGVALSQYESLSQPAFARARDSVANISGDGGSAPRRLAALREALRAHQQEANALGHQLYRQFQEVVSSVDSLVEAGDLQPVAVHRVRTAFHTVQESAAAVAWKLYLPAWELAAGAGSAVAELGILPEESAPEGAGDDPFGGEIVVPSVSPIKPASAGQVTRELDGVEAKVDALLARSLAARKELQAAVAGADGGEPGGGALESAVAAALSAVEPDWRAVGDALARTAKSITQCLDTAGQHEISVRLNSLFGEALAGTHSFSHVLDEPRKLSASMEAILQQQDMLAQSFFRTYHEFINGLSQSPAGVSGGGVVGDHAISLSHRRSRPHQNGQGQGADGAGRDLDGLCAAIGQQSSGLAAQTSHLSKMSVIRLDARRDEDEEEAEAAQNAETARRMLRRAQEVAFGSAQQAAAISWKIHSAAWVLMSGIREATAALTA